MALEPLSVPAPRDTRFTASHLSFSHTSSPRLCVNASTASPQHSTKSKGNRLLAFLELEANFLGSAAAVSEFWALSPLSCFPCNTMQCVSERLTSSHRACSSRLPALPRGCCGPQPRACVAARQQLVTCAAYAAASPSLPANAAATMASPASSHQGPRTSLDPMAASPASKQQAAPRTSLDPMAAAWEEAWAPGRLLTVKSPDQFAALQAEHPEKLIVLMCKSHACRPCKMFTRKYLSIVSGCCGVQRGWRWCAGVGGVPRGGWGGGEQTHACMRRGMDSSSSRR